MKRKKKKREFSYWMLVESIRSRTTTTVARPSSRSIPSSSTRIRAQTSFWGGDENCRGVAFIFILFCLIYSSSS
jgi:hypothetical protein